MGLFIEIVMKETICKYWNGVFYIDRFMCGIKERE